MAYVITTLCERDNKCYDVCPVTCIHYLPDGAPELADFPTYYINPDECIDCGACQPECPHEAIFPMDEVPADYQAEIAKNAEFFAKIPASKMI